MEIIHHIAFHGSDDPKGIIESLGIKYEKSPLPGGSIYNYLIYFDIKESDQAWPQVNALVQEKGAVNRWETIFSEQEILAADWIRLSLLFEQGYPQPENSWRETAYENECPRCGAGYRQKASFHLCKEPFMGKKDFLSLIWTSAIFCTSKILKLFKELDFKGCEVCPAIIHRSKELSNVVSQLIFPHVSAPGLDDRDKNIDERDWGMGTCRVCSITKYDYHNRGYLHIKRQALIQDVDFQLTSEWFGSGHMAFREVLISNRVARLILENDLRKVLLKPVELI